MDDIGTLRQLYEESRLDAAWTEYMRLIGDGPVGADGHLLGALTARLRHDIKAAVVALDRAEAQSPMGVLRGRILLTKGALLRDVGETTASIEYLQRFLANIPEYPELDAVATGFCWYNLGLSFRCARRLGDALGAYTRAAEHCRSHDMPELLCTTLQNMSWVLCLLGRPGDAENALAESYPLCSSEESHWHQRIGQAFLESITGQGASALRRCETIVQACDAAPADVVSHACWVAGRVTLELGRLDEAMSLARNALDWALKAKGDGRTIGDASDLRSEIIAAQRAQTV